MSIVGIYRCLVYLVFRPIHVNWTHISHWSYANVPNVINHLLIYLMDIWTIFTSLKKLYGFKTRNHNESGIKPDCIKYVISNSLVMTITTIQYEYKLEHPYWLDASYLPLIYWSTLCFVVLVMRSDTPPKLFTLPSRTLLSGVN